MELKALPVIPNTTNQKELEERLSVISKEIESIKSLEGKDLRTSSFREKRALFQKDK